MTRVVGHSAAVCAERKQGADSKLPLGWLGRTVSCTMSSTVRRTMRSTVRRTLDCTARRVCAVVALLCGVMPTVARAQVSAWNADPGCAAPSDAPLTSAAHQEPTQDDLSVRVTVVAIEGGWRAVLSAVDHRGMPVGERVLEHPTCDELNHAVLVSLSVLLGTRSPDLPEPPEPAAARGDFDAVTPNGAAPPASAVAEASPPQPVAAAPLQQPEPTEIVRRSTLAARPPEDDGPDVSPSNSAATSTHLDLLPGVIGALESSVARSWGVGLSGVVGQGTWGLHFGTSWRLSAGEVADDPKVSFSVVNGTLGMCHYFDSEVWLVCGGPFLEQLHGTMPDATEPDARAWLVGGGLSFGTVRRSPSGRIGWFANLEVNVRRSAAFQVGDPASTVFQYPSIGVLLSLGPAVRF